MALTTESRFSGGGENRLSLNNKQIYNPVVSQYVQSLTTADQDLFLNAVALGDEKKAQILHEEVPTGSKAFQQFFATAFPSVVYIGVAKDKRIYTAENFIIARILPRKDTAKIRVHFEGAKIFVFPPQRHAEGTRVYNQAYAFESTELELQRWEYGSHWWYEAQFENIDSFKNFIEMSEAAHRIGMVYRYIAQAMLAIQRAPYMQELRTQVLKTPRPVTVKEAYSVVARTFGALNNDLPWAVTRFYHFVNNLIYERLGLIPRPFDTLMFPQGTNYLQMFGGPTGDTRVAQHFLDASHSGVRRATKMLKNGPDQVIPSQLPAGVEWGEWKIPKVDDPDVGMKHPLTLKARTGAFIVWDLQTENPDAMTDDFKARRGLIRTYSREENGIGTFNYLDAIKHMAIFHPETGDYLPYLQEYINKYAKKGWPTDAYEDITGNINQYIQRIDRENAIKTHDVKYYDLIRRVGDREELFQSYEYDTLHAERGACRLLEVLACRGITVESVQAYLQLLQKMTDIPYTEASKNYLRAFAEGSEDNALMVAMDPNVSFNVANLPEWVDGFPTIAYGYVSQPSQSYLYDLFVSGQDREWKNHAPKFVDDMISLFPIGKIIFQTVSSIWIESDLFSPRLLQPFLQTNNNVIDAMTSMILIGFGMPLTGLWIPAKVRGRVPDSRDKRQLDATHYTLGLLAGAKMHDARVPVTSAQAATSLTNFTAMSALILQEPGLDFLLHPRQWDSELFSFFIWTDFETTSVAHLFPTQDTVLLQSVLRSVLDNPSAAKTVQRWMEIYRTQREYGDVYQSTSTNALHKEFLFMFAREFALPYTTSKERDRMRVALAIMFFKLLGSLDDIDKQHVGPSTRVAGRTPIFYNTQRQGALNDLPTGPLTDVAAKKAETTTKYIHSRLLVNSRSLAQTYNLNADHRKEAFMLPTDETRSFSPIAVEKLSTWIDKLMARPVSRWKHVLFQNVEPAAFAATSNNTNNDDAYDDDDYHISGEWQMGQQATGSRKRKIFRGLKDVAPLVTIYRNGQPNRNMRERIDALLESTHDDPLKTLAGLAWLLSAVNGRTLQSHFRHGLPVFEPTVLAGWPAIELLTDSVLFALADRDPATTGTNSTGGVYVYMSHLTRDWENQNISEAVTQTRLFLGGHVTVPNNVLIWPHAMIRSYLGGMGREPISPEDDGFCWDVTNDTIGLSGDMLYMACGPSVRRYDLMQKAITLSTRTIYVPRAPGAYESYDDSDEPMIAFPMQHFYSTIYDFSELFDEPGDFKTFEELQRYKSLTPMLPLSHDFPVNYLSGTPFERAKGWSLFDDVELEQIQAKLSRFE